MTAASVDSWRGRELVILIAATILAGAMAVSNQSYWIDEGVAALKALQPTLGQWWDALRAEGHSNLQLLLHLSYIWGWEKIFGHSEISLRAANIPWLLAGILAMHWGLAGWRRYQLWFPVLALTNAFVWYYVNEARPYIVVFAGACISFACLLRAVRQRADVTESVNWFRMLCVGTLILCAGSMIAVPWALGAFVATAFVVGFARFGKLAWRWRYSTAIFLILLGGLAGYYLWTISIGARANVATTSIANLIFILYELLGLSGIGPGRILVRDEGLRAFLPYLPMLAVTTAAALPVFWHIIRTIRENLTTRNLIIFLLIVALPITGIMAAGIFGEVRLLGRHMMPLLPVVLLAIAAGLERLFTKGGVIAKLLAVFLLLLLFYSALQIRFAPRHAKDDYRGAARIALSALERNETVWWAADESTGMYYGVPVGETVLQVRNPDSARIASLPRPDVIVLSKPDLYDTHGAISQFVEQQRFARGASLQAFEIWRKR